VLRKLETVMLFSAMMLAVVLEAALVYWIFQRPVLLTSPPSSFQVKGEWTGIALPQGWLFGALLVLVYRATVTFHPPRSWANSDKGRNRTAFLRLWRWTVVLMAIQGLALFLGNANAS
jgi:hypothetical protein